MKFMSFMRVSLSWFEVEYCSSFRLPRIRTWNFVVKTRIKIIHNCFVATCRHRCHGCRPRILTIFARRQKYCNHQCQSKVGTLTNCAVVNPTPITGNIKLVMRTLKNR